MALNIESLLPHARAAESWVRGALSQVAGQEPREPIPVSRYAEVAALQNQLNELEAPFGSPAAGAVVEMLPLALPFLASTVRSVPRGASRLLTRKRRQTAPAQDPVLPPGSKEERQVQARLQSVLGELDALQTSLKQRRSLPREVARAAPLSLAFVTVPAKSLAARALEMTAQVRNRIQADLRNARRNSAAGSGAIRRGYQSAVAAVRGAWSPINTGHGSLATARHLNQGSAILAGSMLLYSVVAHYRGRFGSRTMYTPMVISAVTLATNAHGTTDRRPGAHHTRQAIAVAAAGLGLVGAGLHIFNGRSQFRAGVPSRTAIPATVGSVIAGLLGATAEWMRHRPAPTGRRRVAFRR